MSGPKRPTPISGRGSLFLPLDLGRLASQTYPTCATASDCPGATPRGVYYGYTNGYLTSVLPYYAQSISYYPNGMVDEVTHATRIVEAASGPVENQDISTSTYLPRPTAINSSGVTLSDGARPNDLDDFVNSLIPFRKQ